MAWSWLSWRDLPRRVGGAGAAARGSGRLGGGLGRAHGGEPEPPLARLLFHLERYHVAAPRLLAYGQRRRGWRIEAFVLREAAPPCTTPLDCELRAANPFRSEALLRELASLITRLHVAGCEARSIDVFAVEDDGEGCRIRVIAPERLGFDRRLSPRQRASDVRLLLRSMRSCCTPEELSDFAKQVDAAACH